MNEKPTSKKPQYIQEGFLPDYDLTITPETRFPLDRISVKTADTLEGGYVSAKKIQEQPIAPQPPQKRDENSAPKERGKYDSIHLRTILASTMDMIARFYSITDNPKDILNFIKRRNDRGELHDDPTALMHILADPKTFSREWYEKLDKEKAEEVRTFILSLDDDNPNDMALLAYLGAMAVRYAIEQSHKYSSQHTKKELHFPYTISSSYNKAIEPRTAKVLLRYDSIGTGHVAENKLHLTAEETLESAIIQACVGRLGHDAWMFEYEDSARANSSTNRNAEMYDEIMWQAWRKQHEFTENGMIFKRKPTENMPDDLTDPIVVELNSFSSPVSIRIAQADYRSLVRAMEAYFFIAKKRKARHDLMRQIKPETTNRTRLRKNTEIEKLARSEQRMLNLFHTAKQRFMQEALEHAEIIDSGISDEDVAEIMGVRPEWLSAQLKKAHSLLGITPNTTTIKQTLKGLKTKYNATTEIIESDFNKAFSQERIPEYESQKKHRKPKKERATSEEFPTENPISKAHATEDIDIDIDTEHDSNNTTEHTTIWVSRSEKAPEITDPSELFVSMMHIHNIPVDEWNAFLKRDIGIATLEKAGVNMIEVEKAAQTIINAAHSGQKVFVVGDYDNDGITAAASMSELLAELGADFKAYCPHRDEGYGFNRNITEKHLSSDLDVVIIVDSGTGKRAAKEINRIKEDPALQHIKFIIFDHHTPSPDFVPEATIITSQRASASGLVYMFNKHMRYEYGVAVPEQVDLAGSAVRSDMMSMKDAIARALVHNGEERIRTNPRESYKALCRSAGLNYQSIEGYEMDYKINPMINAAGRIGHAQQALVVMRADELLRRAPKEGFSYDVQPHADHLYEQNRDRQKRTQAAILDARKMWDGQIQEWNDPYETGHTEPPIIILRMDIEPGIAGLVAQEFDRPTVILSNSEDELKGSARSIIGKVSIHGLLQKAEDHMITFGGHSQAAGCTVNPADFDAFRDKLMRVACEHITPDILEPKAVYDIDISLDMDLEQLYEEIQKLKPFGKDFIEPVFRLENVHIINGSAFGKNNEHLKMRAVLPGYGAIQCLAFGQANRLEDDMHGFYDLIAQIRKSTYGGKEAIELHIKDFKKHSPK